MPPRPKLIGDKDRLVPLALRTKVLAYLQASVASKESRSRQAGYALLALRLALQAGLRVSEIARLRVQDCDLARAPYRLYVVGGKMRAKDHVDEQPIPEDLATFLRGHLAGLPPDAYVVGLRPKPFHRGYLYQLVKAAHRACGVPEIYNVHSWRHAYGTEVYRKTRDLVLTKGLMRHSETATTERYVHMADMDAEMGRVMKGLVLEEEPVAKPAKRSATARAAKAGRRG